MSAGWRRCLAFFLLLGGLAAPLALYEAFSTPASAAVEVADLKDQLRYGLQARRPEELAFIERVVAMVEEERLPLDLVKSTFQWARRKKSYKAHPFQYFERALRIRAGELGIRIE